MEILIFLVVLSLPAAVLIYLFYRLRAMDQRIEKLSKELNELRYRDLQPHAHAPMSHPSTAAPPLERPVPSAAEAFLRASPAPVRVAAPPAPPPPRTDWESLIGGNWLNKLGMFLVVVGIALALGYSFAHVGPAGRVATSLAVSFAMIGAGVAIERRERYRIFARGLMGGGWAALYFTVYAMYALEAARVLHSAILAAALLFGVAAGMIGHALRYRSPTVAGLAYFIAFATLDITDVTAFSVIALIPLAASLLYIARQFDWPLFARLGLIATYATCALRGDSGASLWTAQSVFAIYWLLFEGFDLLSPDSWLVPLNALGFLTLSGLKWERMAPDHMWQLCAAGAIAYLAGAMLRVRTGRWHGSATFAAGLCAVAILLRAEIRWAPFWLLAEGELLYLAGLRFGSPYLRYLAAAVFGVEALQIGFQVESSQAVLWSPGAALSAAVFYANRALRAADRIYGYAAAAMLALVLGYRAPRSEVAVAWTLLAVALFLLGRWRRMPDFFHQALGLMAIAFVASWDEPIPETAIVVAGLYATQLVLARGSQLRILYSLMATVRLAALLYSEVSGSLLTVAWGMQGVLLLAAGFPLRDRVLRLSGMALFGGCILKLFAYDLRNLETLPRIFSFLVLGLILVGVSWLYTRFREQLQRYL